MHRPGGDKGTWDGVIRIVKDARRARYCAEQLTRVSAQDTLVREFADKILQWLDDGLSLDHTHAQMLEQHYRVCILKQRTRGTAAWQT